MSAKGADTAQSAEFPFADALGPLKTIHVYEPSIGLRGILVVDNVAAGPSIGGLRIAPDVSSQECFRLARAMTLKNAAAEKGFLARLQDRELTFGANTDLIVEGQPYQFSYILKDGWAMSYKLLPDGSRQVVNFLLPGDFIGLRANWFQTAEASVSALTDIVVSPIQPHRIVTGARRFPRLGAAIAWSSARDESMLIEHLVSLGRRSAYERLSHLFLELRKRLQIIGFAGDRSFELPVTQEVLGDFLGLTIVHVNRTLRKLIRNGLIEREGERLIIRHLGDLEAAADFDDEYLKQEKSPKRTEHVVREIEPSKQDKKVLDEVEAMDAAALNRD
jgi:CRP-like cAMP-binding protein